ncbi:MAG: leucine-rich repeat domain-containing protein, partial [Prevotella sp.]|nr:leucine-rich repeat domain-containing protein [Prevotella sp.]
FSGYTLKELSEAGYSNVVNYVLAVELKKCITAKGPSESNYTSNVWIYTGNGNSYDGGNTVYITYQYTGEIKKEDTWTVGNFTFSTIYDKTNSTNVKNKIKLPAGTCAVKLNKYTDTEVTIPLEDPQKKKKVVALQTLAMCEKVDHTLTIINCLKYNDDLDESYFDQYSDEYGWYFSGNQTNDHSNGSLTKVTFEKDATTGQSNIRSIGDYAFQSCYVLQTIEIPQSLEYLGEACFSQCDGLTDGLTFQRTSGTSFTTNFKVIRNYTFWNCRHMTDLELPDGIIVIEGQQSGSSMQYMTSLAHLRLPNTLVAVGPHFLCDASSLTEVTIPASVKYIDGACFHGCESLETVYLLGPASALQGVYDGSDTFGSNRTMCKGNVSNCVFITTQDNIEGYAKDPNNVWQKIADNRTNCQSSLKAVEVNQDGEVVRNDDGEPQLTSEYLKYPGTNGSEIKPTACGIGEGNALTYFPDQKVQYTPGKWVTVILPKKYDRAELERKFGSDVMLAEMTGFKDNQPFSYVNGLRTYHLKFTEVKNPEAHKPYMIKPGHIVKDKTAADYNSPYWVTLIACTEMGEDYRIERTKDHALPIKCTEDQTEVVMYGRYQTYDMLQWQFYFMNPLKNGEYNKACVFKRIVDPNEAPTIKPFRCYWRIWLKGEAQDAGAGAKTAFFRFADDNETTGIEQVDSKISIEISGIYDMNGRKLDVKKEDLPKGIFIIDGKKVMVK